MEEPGFSKSSLKGSLILLYRSRVGLAINFFQKQIKICLKIKEVLIFWLFSGLPARPGLACANIASGIALIASG
ncbi:MAG: hypothetical protein LBC41_18125 [Clostridiales bacterium]|jgi:hypothetical protein|nr:hypothetical protein [Clostridiales bacterium]